MKHNLPPFDLSILAKSEWPGRCRSVDEIGDVRKSDEWRVTSDEWLGVTTWLLGRHDGASVQRRRRWLEVHVGEVVLIESRHRTCRSPIRFKPTVPEYLYSMHLPVHVLGLGKPWFAVPPAESSRSSNSSQDIPRGATKHPRSAKEKGSSKSPPLNRATSWQPPVV